MVGNRTPPGGVRVLSIRVRLRLRIRVRVRVRVNLEGAGGGGSIEGAVMKGEGLRVLRSFAERAGPMSALLGLGLELGLEIGLGFGFGFGVRA